MLPVDRIAFTLKRGLSRDWSPGCCACAQGVHRVHREGVPFIGSQMSSLVTLCPEDLRDFKSGLDVGVSR